MKKGMWGGRFKKEMHPVLKKFSYSLAVDGELLSAELEVNRAWAKMLGRTGIIKTSEAAQIVRALDAVEKEFNGRVPCEYLKDHEDVHSLVQSFVEKKAGAVAKKIHTGRSRNDLVVTSTRVYLRGKIEHLLGRMQEVQKALVIAAGKAEDQIVAGMTHLRKAQPVLMAHHLLAYVEMIEDDRERLQDALKRVNVMPLGAAALAGSALPIDQKSVAKELGFSKIAPNSMAATADRAFLAEFLSAVSILWMHLSRLSEDFVIWNNEAFGYVELDDAFATGSSLMPQKKNPDVFELVRGRAGVIFSNLQALLTLQKGLPLAYNRDLQEDKPAVFEAIKKTDVALELLALTIESVEFRPEALKESVQDDTLFATDILEYLVRKGVAFSEAHETVGKIVRHAQDSGKPVRDLSVQEWKSFSRLFDSKVYDLFDPQVSVGAKKTIGSTNPARVRQEISKWQKKLKGVKIHA